MPTARVPVPTAVPGGDVPPTAGIRLRRLSGREVPMWLDEGRTAGPVYYGQAQQELWADTGPYDLLVQPRPPSGPTHTVRIQVGTGTTIAPDEDTVTYDDLTAALAAERALAGSRFTANNESETITGAWDFTTPPLVGGEPIGTTPGTAGVTDDELTAALVAERAAFAAQYAGVDVAETITGAWDFQRAPTVNGAPITAAGGLDQDALEDFLIADSPITITPTGTAGFDRKLRVGLDRSLAIDTGEGLYQLWLGQGNTGTKSQFLATLEGDDLYEIAQANGFSGTFAEFQESMRGPKGDPGPPGVGVPGPPGLSAHQEAMLSGAPADRDEWIKTLVGPPGVGGTLVDLDGVPQTHVSLSSAPITAADVGAATVDSVNQLRSLVELLQERVNNAPGVSPTTQDWNAVKELAVTSPVILAARGAGTNIAKDWALSSLDFLAQNLTTRMVADGGDVRLTSDGALVNLSGSTLDSKTSGTGNVSAVTLAQFKALFHRDHPYHRGTISTEQLTDFGQWLDRLKTLGRWAMIEDILMTAGPSGTTQKVVDAVTARDLKTRTMYSGYALDATQATARLGPAKTAGMPVCLLQNTGNIVGFPATLTAVNGGPPDAVFSGYTSAPGNDDTWVKAAIDGGIAVVLGTFNRRHDLEQQQQRLIALGGKLTVATSDDPFYLARAVPPRVTFRFDTQQWDHGMVPSTQTTVDPKVVGGKLHMDSTTTAQFMLMGAWAHDQCWAQLEIDLTFTALDTTTSRWGQVFTALADDGNYHDGTAMRANIAFYLRQTGELAIGNRTSSTAVTTVASNASTFTMPTGATRSSTTLTPVVVNQPIRLRLQHLRNPDGSFSGQARFTRLDTGDFVQTAPAAAPVRGPYWHLGKNGTAGGTVAWSGLALTL